MKKTNRSFILLLPLLLFFFTIFPALSEAFPRPIGFVNDYVSVMKPETRDQLENILENLRIKTGAEVGVVIVEDLGGMDINSYAEGLMKEWGIGSSERRDGILVLVSVEDRHMRIEVGYGLEHIITDARAGMIRDSYMTPHLKNNDYDSGVFAGAVAVASMIAESNGIQLEMTGMRSTPLSQEEEYALSPLHFIIFIILLILMVSTRTGRSLLYLMLISQMLGGGRRRSSSGFGGGFGGGFSSGSGGFGGFGGGFSGGGGAAGRF